MSKSKLYLFVEGPDDRRFFEKIICPIFKIEKCDVIEWAQMSKVTIDKFIKSILEMNDDYLFFTDFDDSICISAKKDYIITFRASCVERRKILVVKKEIEAWYLAGLNKSSAQKLKIPELKTTDHIDKQKFNQLLPSRLRYKRTVFLINILNFYNLRLASKKNSSLNYFLQSFLSN